MEDGLLPSRQQRVRLESYPSRLRARIAGRVLQVSFSAPGQPARYEAVLEVDKSRPLAPVSVHALSAIPVVEVIGDDMDDQAEVAADSDQDETDDSAGDQVFPQYRVHQAATRPAPLYPEYPPLASGERVHLIWQGQKYVSGIIAGTYLRCSGMLSLYRKPARIYNPRYEIIPHRS
ncbi:MAG: asparaginase [Rothia sp. (in: high G+C Gram-positive bacteria)]|nr:asparaginase [Rothia sp. (in: high G+C Gram-positive bacteria)]